MAKTRAEMLAEELNDLRSGIPYHSHRPRDGSPAFRCTSPYCDDLGGNCPKGEPLTNESREERMERYSRGELAENT